MSVPVRSGQVSWTRKASSFFLSAWIQLGDKLGEIWPTQFSLQPAFFSTLCSSPLYLLTRPSPPERPQIRSLYIAEDQQRLPECEGGGGLTHSLSTATALQCMEDRMQPVAGGTGSSGPPQGGQQMNKVRGEERREPAEFNLCLVFQSGDESNVRNQYSIPGILHFIQHEWSRWV